MICKNCGTEFKEGIFCPECGTKNEEVIIDEKAIAKSAEMEKNKEEKEKREGGIKVVKEEIEKNVSLEDEDIKNEASNRIREDAVQKAKMEEVQRIQNEENKKLEIGKKINRKAILSLVFGIVSWIGIITVIIPIICGIWSIVDGVKALRGKTKYKKCAIIGMILSTLIFILLIWIILQPSSSVSETQKIVENQDTEIADVDTEIIDGDTESSDTVSENIDTYEKEDAANFLGVLGKDCFLSDFNNQPTGVQFVFTSIFWNTRKDKYGYSFSYKVHNADGSSASQAFFVKDNTDGTVLSVLDNVSYKDEVAVKITAVFDKTEIIIGEESGSTQIVYYVTAIEAEILEADSSEAKEATGNYYHIGDAVALNNGISYTIVDGGVYTEYDKTFVFIELDIDNQSGGDISISASDVSFYADNYILNTGYPLKQDSRNLNYMTISDNRKGSGRFYAECPDYDSFARIEAEIGNIVIVVKDVSDTTEDNMDISDSENINPLSLTEGKYVYDNGTDGISTAEVGYSLEYGGNLIFIDCWGYGDHEIIYFEGLLEENDDGSYYAYCEDFEASINAEFTNNGLYIKVYSDNYPEMYSMEGFYTLQ